MEAAVCVQARELGGGGPHGEDVQVQTRASERRRQAPTPMSSSTVRITGHFYFFHLLNHL